MNNALVDADWLQQQQGKPNLVILDATMHKAVIEPFTFVPTVFVPQAIKFDLDHVFMDADSAQPNTLPNETIFTQQAQALGIHKDSLIVIYDARGVYSSPRAWWMFKVMGHQAVYVLNGGLKAWQAAGYNVAEQALKPNRSGDFIAHYQADLVKSAEQVLTASKQENSLIIDVRGEKRFYGQIAESRAGIRAGHIPNSVNLPFLSLLVDGYFLADIELVKRLSHLDLTHKNPLIFSCGSGITACIVLLAAYHLGYKNLTLYDGSWTEWGGRDDLPIATISSL